MRWIVDGSESRKVPRSGLVVHVSFRMQEALGFAGDLERHDRTLFPPSHFMPTYSR